jgi:soluble cytochrome b562
MDKAYLTKLVADAVKYLGDKISKSKIQLDLNSLTIEKLQNVDYRQINQVVKELREMGENHKGNTQELISSLKELENCLKQNPKTNGGYSKEDNRQVLIALNKLNDSLQTLNKKDQSSKVIEALSKVEKAIFNLEIEVEEPDFSTLENELKSLRKDFSNFSQSLTKGFDKIAENLGQLPKTFDFPKEFKLDKEQLRSIRSNGGGGVVSLSGDLKVATNWTVARVALTNANTEYSYTFPNNTQSWTMKLRDPGATLYYSSATGKFPTSGDSTTYMTMLPIGTRSQDNVEWSGKTVYLQSDTATQVVEIEVFTL